MSRKLLFNTLLLLNILPGCSQKDEPVLKTHLFQASDQTCKVHTWWHWMDNAITKDGISLDLESMQKQQISTATILNVRRMNEADFGVAPVIFHTAEWYDMFRWSLDEAKRLGIIIGAHNCNGWSTTGGPWVTPEFSMKRCTWNKTFVEGGRVIDMKIPKPAHNFGFYQDIQLIAYPGEYLPNSFEKAIPSIVVNNNNTGGRLFDGNPFSVVTLKEGSTLHIRFNEPFNADQLVFTIFSDKQYETFKKGDFVLKYSHDDIKFHEIKRFGTTILNEVVTINIPSVTARYFSLEFMARNGPASEQSVDFGELALLWDNEKTPYRNDITNHLKKTVTSRANKRNELFSSNSTEAPSVDIDRIIDLSDRLDATGNLKWDAPEGNWTILRMGYTTTGATNHPSSVAGRGLEIDKMDTTALNLHFLNFPLKLIEAAGPHTGNTFRFLLVDSWECKFQNWTGNFAYEFKKRRGYSITPWLAVIAGDIVENNEATERFLHDYRHTIAELIEENYYLHYTRLCHQHGLQIHAEVIYGGTIYPPLDILKTNSFIDVPMSEFWATGPYKPLDKTETNMVAAAATISGKEVIAAEAYTGFADYSETPWDLKHFGDQAYCSGINQMTLHSYVHQPFEKKPGMTLGEFGLCFNRHIPWWDFADSWMNYQARIQYVLQNSWLSADILYLLSDRLYDNGISNDQNYQIPPGYNVQVCNSDILKNQSKVKNGKIILNNGLSYHLLVLPNDSCMELATLKTIHELARKGANILGPKPSKTLSYNDSQNNDTQLQRLASDLWGDGPEALATGRKFGKGRVFGGTNIKGATEALGLKPVFSQEPAMGIPLIFSHRVTGNDDVFFLVNQEDKFVNRICTFRTTQQHPEIWNPTDGSVTVPSEIKKNNDLTSFSIPLQPKESLFLVFRKYKTPGIRVAQSLKEIHRLEDIQGMMRLNTDDSVLNIPLSEYILLKNSDIPEVKYFSGIFNIGINFDLPSEVTELDPLFLSPGNFNASCQLIFNGHILGNAVFPGHRFNITGLANRKGNTLQINIGTNYRNRIIGDFRKYGGPETLWTTSPLSRYFNNNPDLSDAGLQGPIGFFTY